MQDLMIKNIKNKIYTIRNKQVMLDSDLAYLYVVSTKVLNQAVKRNICRFPEEFMFQLTEGELENLKLQTDTLKSNSLRFQNGILKDSLELIEASLRSQNVTLEKGRGKHKKYLPYAFTEQGVAMLSGILRSDIAVSVSIQIINDFVVMKNYRSNNFQIFNRLDRVEIRQLEYDMNFNKIFDALENHKPEQGIFFDGQIFDAHKFISDLISSANESIILIDNYVDYNTLTLFTERNEKVIVDIYTKKITRKLKLDLNKLNKQYSQINVKEFDKSHDRFLIIDKVVYHFGASLKDLGKKWFAFSKLDLDCLDLLKNIKL